MPKLKVVANNNIKIEKGIPLPDRMWGAGRPQKYPLDAMEVGDSFFIPGAKMGIMGNSLTLAKRRSPGRKWTSRTVEGGVRVWRVQ